jgi:ketosteroid isomerase-like protein
MSYFSSMTSTESIRRLYAAVADGDAAAAAAHLAPDAVLHIPGDNPLAGDHTGRVAILEVLARVRAGGERVELIDVLAGREHTAAYCRVRMDGVGGFDGLDNSTVHLFRMAGDRIGEAWFHNRDQAAVDAHWKAATR